MEEQQLLLMDALKRAEAGNRAKTFFLFNMSHDIRTPMNAILGFTEIALRSVHDVSKLTDCLEKIPVSGKHLLQQINNILDMAKMENGEISLSEKSCDLTQCIQIARELLQPEADSRQLILQTDLTAAKNRQVYCDSLRLNQVLFNLLSNAVKFSRPGGTVLVTLIQAETGSIRYCLSIFAHPPRQIGYETS